MSVYSRVAIVDFISVAFGTTSYRSRSLSHFPCPSSSLATSISRWLTLRLSQLLVVELLVASRCCWLVIILSISITLFLGPSIHYIALAFGFFSE
mgnify:CR=1 FL=1